MTSEKESSSSSSSVPIGSSGGEAEITSSSPSLSNNGLTVGIFTYYRHEFILV